MIDTPIDNIAPFPDNAKNHPKKQVKQIARSIQQFGFNQPIVVDKDSVIIVGHGRYEAAKFLKMATVPVVKLPNLNPADVEAYRLADNKLNESTWDMGLVIEKLKILNEEGYDITVTGFGKDLVLEPGDKDNNAPPFAKGKPKAQIGDVFLLGTHRIMCGDSTNENQVKKLMNGVKANMVFTDPPYNVAYEGGGSYAENGNPKREKILNDKMTKEQFYVFLERICARIHESCGGAVYICMSSSEIDQLKRAFETTGGHWQSFIIWVKNNFTLSRADYQNTYEPILYGWAKGVKNHYFTDNRAIANVWEDLRSVKTEYDGRSTTISFQGFKVKLDGKIEKGSVIRKKQQTDIWRYDKPSVSKDHPTMKPVELCMEAVTNSSEEGGVVLDLFLGSGSTLIAAEKSGRVCYGMELDPKYMDVIIKRWEEYTGKQAKKL